MKEVINMDERTRMWVMVGISAIVLLGIALAIILIAGIDIWSMAMFVIIIALAAIALFMAARNRREIRSGFPLKDERTILLGMRAGNRAFYVSMYLVLFMAFAFAAFEDQGVVISNAELLFVLVALMGSVHIVLTAYYNRKGRGSSE
jgi:uncharacterized membrane protein YhaH (DUF805 family)